LNHESYEATPYDSLENLVFLAKFQRRHLELGAKYVKIGDFRQVSEKWCKIELLLLQTISGK